MTSYPDSVRFLYSLSHEIRVVKWGLETIRRVLAELGNPEQACRFVHVAGTNGKGSTCAMIESGLRAAGEATGLYTSPHLAEPTERICIRGRPVTAQEFARAFDVVHQTSERLLAAGEIETHPTYFETVTAMAFDLFHEAGLDRIVLEVGLGGRLDATNVVMPELCVITPVDYDHETFLGNNVASIASEKAGILKPGVPVIMAGQREEARGVILSRAAELGCPVIDAAQCPAEGIEENSQGNSFRWEGEKFFCPLAGRHQVDNAVTASLALRQMGVEPARIREGIASARWPGRLERVRRCPDIILDGAHNPAGVRALATHIQRHYQQRRVHLIYGTMRDKSIGEICDTLFPLAAEVILTAPRVARALSPESLLAVAGHPRARVAQDLNTALEMALETAAAHDVIFISGSLFLVGEARALLVQ
jgi:dihydrofolate synthase/folylpolyglutamate synthase